MVDTISSTYHAGAKLAWECQTWDFPHYCWSVGLHLTARQLHDKARITTLEVHLLTWFEGLHHFENVVTHNIGFCAPCKPLRSGILGGCTVFHRIDCQPVWHFDESVAYHKADVDPILSLDGRVVGVVGSGFVVHSHDLPLNEDAELHPEQRSLNQATDSHTPSRRPKELCIKK